MLVQNPLIRMYSKTITLSLLGLCIVGILVGMVITVAQESAVDAFIGVCPLH